MTDKNNNIYKPYGDPSTRFDTSCECTNLPQQSKDQRDLAFKDPPVFNINHPNQVKVVFLKRPSNPAIAKEDHQTYRDVPKLFRYES